MAVQTLSSPTPFSPSRPQTSAIPRSLRGGTYRIDQILHITGSRALFAGYRQDSRLPVLVERVTSLDDMCLHRALKRGDAVQTLAHLNLARCVEVFVEAGALYVVSVTGEGQILAHITRTIRQDEAVEWGIQICDALNYLDWQTTVPHALAVDPFTVFVTRWGRVKLADLVSLLGVHTPHHHARFAAPSGTPMQRAVFGIGATLHFLLTGWRGHYHDIPPYIPEASEEVNQVITRALHAHPDQRWADTRLMRQALLPL